jgi:hypothetical protein
METPTNTGEDAALIQSADSPEPRTDQLLAMFERLQPKICALKSRSYGLLLLWVVFAAIWGLCSFFGVPSLYHSVNLMMHHRTSSVIVVSGEDIIVGGGNSGAAETRIARISGMTNKFPADKLYKTGDHVFLTYSSSLNYGIVTSKPPRTYFDYLSADIGALGSVFIPLLVIVIVTLTNFSLITIEALNHVFGAEVLSKLKDSPETLDRLQLIGSRMAQAILVGTLSLVPIVATLAAVSVALRMNNGGLWAFFAIYAVLAVILATHASAFIAIGILKMMRTMAIGGLVVIVGFLVTIVGIGRFVTKLVLLAFSPKVLDLSSWWDVAKEFVRSLLGIG